VGCGKDFLILFIPWVDTSMEIVLTSILAFAATNIDDLFILTLFFGNKKYSSSTVFSGQLTGIGILILISLAGSVIGNFINVQYVGLLGLFPIYLGIKQLLSLRSAEKEDAETTPAVRSGSLLLSIAFITIANGGDNIGIYIPLFVSLSSLDKTIMIAIFFLMTVLWCMIARYLAAHPILEKAIQRYGHIVTPIVLCLLGVYILVESNSFDLLFPA
jgi:cadmium resistance transport/sequestration family protein